MWTLLRIAVRNLLQNRRRTLITLAARFVGVTAMVAMRGLLNGVQRAPATSVVQSQTGALHRGVRRSSIGALVLLEGTILAGLGGLGGAPLARLLVTAVARARRGLFGSGSSLLARYPPVPTIPPVVETLAIATAVVGALLAALYPAWKATRLRPVEALRAV